MAPGMLRLGAGCRMQSISLESMFAPRPLFRMNLGEKKA